MHSTISRFAFRARISAVWLAFSLSIFSLSTAWAADAVSEALDGAWLVAVANDPRDRILLIKGARAEQGKLQAESVLYGWLDSGTPPVKEWSGEVAGDTITLRFVSTADTVVTFSFRGDETSADGKFVPKAGKERDVRVTRIPAEEVAELRAAARTAARAAKDAKTAAAQQPHANANSRITLLYVGASDCEFCRYYEVEYFGRKELMAKVVPDFSKINYVKSNIGSYKSRDKVGPVPDDLKWLAGNASSGRPVLTKRSVPFFALVVDDKVWTQGHGTRALDSLLAPEIRRAVEEKSASR